MALKNKDGNYLRVERIQYHADKNPTAVCTIYKNEEVRRDVTKFDYLHVSNVYMPDFAQLSTELWDIKKSLRNNLITIAYGCIKKPIYVDPDASPQINTNPFADWTDC